MESNLVAQLYSTTRHASETETVENKKGNADLEGEAEIDPLRWHIHMQGFDA